MKDGKVEGAINVLYAMDLSREKRIELPAEAAELSRAAAERFLEARECM